MRLNVATIAILASAAVTASAQPIISAKSGVIAGVEGKVFLDNAQVQESETHFPEMKEGSVLSTAAGRVELMLPPGFMLRMAENGSLKMIANRLIDTRVEILTGSAVVEVDQTKPDFNVTIAVKDSQITLSKVGVYRFDTDPAQIKVYHGTASVELGGQTVLVASGKVLPLTGNATSAQKFDVEQTDALDNWSARRADAMAMANLSAAKYSNDNYVSPLAGNTWIFNPYFGMYTYMPMMGTMYNPFYGLSFYSPITAFNAFYWGPMGYGFGYGIPAYGYGYGYGAPIFGGGGGRTSYTSMHGPGGTFYGGGLASRGGRGISGGGFSGGGFSGGGAPGGGGGGGRPSAGGGISGGGGHVGGGGGTGGHGR